MKVISKRYYNTTCHIVEFPPDEIRLEDTPGIPGKREHISKIFGNPHLDEVTWLRVNRAFFDTGNPKSESMGDALGDKFINVAFKDGKLYFEPEIPANPEWNVGTSYMLLRNGEYSYDNEQYFSGILGKNPRTFFGQRADGTIVFIVADGRMANEAGLTASEQRAVATFEGLKNAANLDGGGSSALMIGDELINKSYDGRSLGNIFVGYRKWQKDELPVIRKGTKSVWVHLMQRLLTAWGIDTDADGSFGPATLESVKKFQKTMHLEVDGICGPKTWAALIKILQAEKKRPTLIIDPGHGGSDPGGVSEGYREKDLTLPIALRLQELLKEFNPALTRDKDVDLPIGGPREALVKNKYDYCLSIHLNMNAGKRVETIHSIHSEKGKKLAQFIFDELCKATGLTGRVFSRENPNKPGVDYYAMHKNTGSTTCVIVELIPLDTCKEYLHIEKLAQAVATGFRKYVEHYNS
ncbi:N-acetylmuramoyl-L-alanine amidase [Thermoclostridium stercorarium]|uniref:N-acetylmuramoyl-L-alanine amidase n=1 Tax=Thermoclostridium stercorarium TaxID=1510 RepID=UPI002B057D30|nr:N-acetylmuramoyl-L-alanine amidase [Thermoclostridium stercorarium]